MVEKDVLTSSLSVREVSPQACCEWASSLKKKITINLFSIIHQSEIWSFTHNIVNSASPWKYFTVLTRSSKVASSSHTKTACGCCWKAETVHMWFTPSSMALYKANALCAPVMRIMTWEMKKHELRESLRDWDKKLAIGGFCWCVRIEQCTVH